MARLDPAHIAAIRSRLAQGTPTARALVGLPVLTTDQLADLDTAVRHDIQGAGPVVGELLDDPAVTDVVVNGNHGIWVDRGAGMERAGADPNLESEDAVRALAVRLAASCGQRLDDSSPIVDGMFDSGVRLHAVIPPLSAEGTLISLRTHRARALSLDELVSSGSVASGLRPVIEALIAERANVIISGSTGAGKTTFLNAMLTLVPRSERILVIEEAAELRPEHPHVVHLQVRHANVQGVGEVSMSELVRAAMRMRPDRIVLGECRGAEVRDVLGALNTGHEGGWATIHANSASDVPARLTALGALADMTEATVAAQAAAALDAVVHVRRSGGRRMVAELAVFRRRGGELACIPALSVDSESGQVRREAGADELLQRLGLDFASVGVPRAPAVGRAGVVR